MDLFLQIPNKKLFHTTRVLHSLLKIHKKLAVAKIIVIWAISWIVIFCSFTRENHTLPNFTQLKNKIFDFPHKIIIQTSYITLFFKLTQRNASKWEQSESTILAFDKYVIYFNFVMNYSSTSTMNILEIYGYHIMIYAPYHMNIRDNQYC